VTNTHVRLYIITLILVPPPHFLHFSQRNGAEKGVFVCTRALSSTQEVYSGETYSINSSWAHG